MSDFKAELPPELDVTPANRSPKRRIAVGIAAVVVVLAGTFTAIALAGGDDNAPTDPVRQLLAAAERNDLLGVLEQLAPGERDAVRGPLQDLNAELNRIGVFKDASLSNFTGYDLKIEDLALEATPVRDGVQTVKVTRGKSIYTIDWSKVPLGKFVRDLAGDGAKERRSGTSELQDGTEDDPIAVVKRDGRWYVSLAYSYAEAARVGANKSVADLGRGVAAAGADSPEAAVREALEAGAKLDVRRLIELLPPDELGAVQDYASLFLADAEKKVQEERSSFSVSISKLDLDADTSGAESLVTVKRLDAEATVNGRTYSVKDGCVDVPRGPGELPEHLCPGRGAGDLLETFGMPGSLQPPRFSFEGKHPKVGIVATRVDGKWYVSPTRTVLRDLVAVLKLVEPSDLEKGRDWVKQIMGLATAFDSETRTAYGPSA